MAVSFLKNVLFFINSNRREEGALGGRSESFPCGLDETWCYGKMQPKVQRFVIRDHVHVMTETQQIPVIGNGPTRRTDNKNRFWSRMYQFHYIR